MDWLTMSNIIKFNDLQNIGIRVTDDSRYSVFDVIAFCGKKNPRQTWESFQSRFPEIAAKAINYKFPGKGQRETPVASYDIILEILAVIGKAPGQSIVTSDKFYPRTEDQIILVLQEAFIDCQPIKQFYCFGYKIDLYLAKCRIAIECDEYRHKQYDTTLELNREKCIKSALGCSFVRFDPYAIDFNLGVVVKKIRDMLY
jgi:very-short-patch-repair endonuclease